MYDLDSCVIKKQKFYKILQMSKKQDAFTWMKHFFSSWNYSKMSDWMYFLVFSKVGRYYCVCFSWCIIVYYLLGNVLLWLLACLKLSEPEPPK